MICLHEKAISNADGTHLSHTIIEDPAGIIRGLRDRNLLWRASDVVQDHAIEEYLKPMSEAFIWAAVLIPINHPEEEDFEPLMVARYDA